MSKLLFASSISLVTFLISFSCFFSYSQYLPYFCPFVHISSTDLLHIGSRLYYHLICVLLCCRWSKSKDYMVPQVLEEECIFHILFVQLFPSPIVLLTLVSFCVCSFIFTIDPLWFTMPGVRIISLQASMSSAASVWFSSTSNALFIIAVPGSAAFCRLGIAASIFLLCPSESGSS